MNKTDRVKNPFQRSALLKEILDFFNSEIIGEKLELSELQKKTLNKLKELTNEKNISKSKLKRIYVKRGLYITDYSLFDFDVDTPMNPKEFASNARKYDLEDDDGNSILLEFWITTSSKKDVVFTAVLKELEDVELHEKNGNPTQTVKPTLCALTVDPDIEEEIRYELDGKDINPVYNV